MGDKTKAVDKVSCDLKAQDEMELLSDIMSCNLGVPRVADKQSKGDSCNPMDPRGRWTRVRQRGVFATTWVKDERAKAHNKVSCNLKGPRRR